MNKEVKSYGLKVLDSSLLLVPLYNIEGNLVGMQTIDHEGNKKYTSGSTISGSFYPIQGGKDVIYICEGYATAATIYEVTGKTTYCAMNAGNLPEVARVLRQKCPYTHIVIAADNDQFTDGNPGISKAKEAANQNICFIAYPEFVQEDLKEKPTDYNDFCQLYGKRRTQYSLERTEKPDSGIYIRKGYLPEIVDEAEQHLVLLDQNVYQYGPYIITPAQKDAKKLRVLDSINLQERLARVCNWYQYDSRSKA